MSCLPKAHDILLKLAYHTLGNTKTLKIFDSYYEHVKERTNIC